MDGFFVNLAEGVWWLNVRVVSKLWNQSLAVGGDATPALNGFGLNSQREYSRLQSGWGGVDTFILE